MELVDASTTPHTYPLHCSSPSKPATPHTPPRHPHRCLRALMMSLFTHAPGLVSSAILLCSASNVEGFAAHPGLYGRPSLSSLTPSQQNHGLAKFDGRGGDASTPRCLRRSRGMMMSSTVPPQPDMQPGLSGGDFDR